MVQHKGRWVTVGMSDLREWYFLEIRFEYREEVVRKLEKV